VDRLYGDYLKTIKQLRERYRKGIRVLEENRLGSINKKESLKNELPKGDLRGAPADVFRVVFLSIRRESVLLLLSS